MKNKAFTIVEMAFVLVIVGLIVTMAVKGNQMVEYAKLRKEMLKVQKFQVALAGYWAREGSMPGNPTDTRVAGQALADAGIASMGDQVNSYSDPSTTPRPMWQLSYCIETAAYGFSYSFVQAQNAKSACVEAGRTSYYFVCNYEVSYDDGNAGTGSARAQYPTGINAAMYEDCDLTPNGYMEFNVKIF